MLPTDEMKAKVLDEQLFNADEVNLNIEHDLHNLRELVNIGHVVELWEDGVIE